MKERKVQFILIFAFSILLFIPLAVIAQETVELTSPIGAKEASGPGATIIDVVFASFAGFAGIFGILVFGFIVINAFKLIISRGNEESITKAKQGLTWSIVAFIIAIFAFSLISAVSQILGGKSDQNELDLAEKGLLSPPIRDAGFVEAFDTFFTGVLGVTVVAATLMIVYAGIKMVTSSGNEEQITSAKTILKWAVVGIVVTGLAFVILKGLDTVFT